MERIMLKSYTHTPVIVDSESTRKDLLQLDSFQDISVFNLGVELDKIKKYTHIKKAQTPTIIYLGRLKKYKRIDHIIQAVNRLKGDIPNIKLNILGTGDDEKRLTRLVLDLDLNDNISFKGFVTEKQKYEMLTEAWSLVICSEKEGWGLVVIEGNACGTPAIGYDVEGLRDSINNKYSGYLIENANIEKLSTQIRELLENTQERKEISKNAMKWSERFNWDNTAKTFYDLSKRVLKNSKS